MVGKVMELKDMILSTLEELDIDQDISKEKKQSFQSGVEELTKEIEVQEIDLGDDFKSKKKSQKQIQPQQKETKQDVKNIEKELTFADSLKGDDREFLMNLRERGLVLFEGFQSPKKQKIEAKLELTLNFLEYLLATVDEKLENIK